MQSKQYFTKIKNYPHEKSTEPVSSLVKEEDISVEELKQLIREVENANK